MSEQGPNVEGERRHRVVFTPTGLSAVVDTRTSVLDAARELGVDLDSVCGGRAVCGRCQVVVGTGTFAKWALTSSESSLSARSPDEVEFRGRRPLAEGARLGCHALIEADVVIDVPAESQIHRQVVRKDVELGDLTLDPLVSLHLLDVPAEPEDRGSALAHRLLDTFESAWGHRPAAVHPSQLDRLHDVLPDHGAAQVTVAVRDEVVVAAWPGFVDQVTGLAVDIGSTTVAGHLCDLTTGEVLASAGRMNPQIRFGEDLMSRVSYVMLNEGGRVDLTDAVREAIAALIDDVLDASGLPRDQLLEIVFVGNPIMHHLLLGIDPTPLGQAPFPLATDSAISTSARALDLDSDARVYVGPCIAGHVGADTAAAMLAEKPYGSETTQLLVDVGTNAEIVLGNRTALWAASSPTGPAFEGAQISSGQRATPGAIERVRIDGATLEPRFQVIGVEEWSDDPAFEAAIEDQPITGICGSGIIEVVAELFLAGVIDRDGVISPRPEPHDRIVAAGRTYDYVLHRDDERELRVTQADVRAIQLAKAALRAGIELLLERSGIESIDEIRLAGAFGAHISPLHAMVLGLVPDCALERVRSVGNSAGSGAVRALLSRHEREEMEAAVARVVKVETATEPTFQEHFVAALALPHASAVPRHLADLVTLPTTAPTTKRRTRRQRRSGG